MSDGDIIITPALTIPRAELHREQISVEPDSTRVELLWDLTHSTVVSDEQRGRLLTKLAARLDAAGMVRVVASDRRSQSQNRDAAAERLAVLVRQALVVPRKRRPTRPTRASREQRLADKRKRGERKRDRRRDTHD